MIPKLSAPLVKDIRTGEGLAEYLLGIGSAVLAVTGDVNIKYGLGVTTLAVLVKGARRGLLKLVALQKGAGIGAPLEPHNIEGVVGKLLPELAVAPATDTEQVPGAPATTATS